MTIEKAAVIGAGVMGNGIAHVCALGGFFVNLMDESGEILQKSLKMIEQNLQKGVERGKLKPEQKTSALARLTCVTDLKEAVCDAGLVTEAVTEDLNLKQEVFSRLDNYCPEDTCLASNTSAISITEIAAATNRPDKVIGLNF